MSELRVLRVGDTLTFRSHVTARGVESGQVVDDYVRAFDVEVVSIQADSGVSLVTVKLSNRVEGGDGRGHPRHHVPT